MPAAMRRAISCVLPEPAPASTMRLWSRSVTMRWREAASRRSLMAREPPVGVQLGCGLLAFRAFMRIGSACGAVVAELAVFLVGRMHVEALSKHIAKVTQDLADIGLGLHVDLLAILAPFRAGEVVR